MTTPYSDSFTDYAAGALETVGAANWERRCGAAGSITVTASHRIIAVDLGPEGPYLAEPALYAFTGGDLDDGIHYAQLALSNLYVAMWKFGGPAVRIPPGGTGGYALIGHQEEGSWLYKLLRINADGSETVLASAEGSRTDGLYTITAEDTPAGTVLTGYRGETQLVTYTDAAKTWDQTNVRAGVYTSIYIPLADDFEAGPSPAAPEEPGPDTGEYVTQVYPAPNTAAGDQRPWIASVLNAATRERVLEIHGWTRAGVAAAAALFVDRLSNHPSDLDDIIAQAFALADTA